METLRWNKYDGVDRTLICDFVTPTLSNQNKVLLFIFL